MLKQYKRSLVVTTLITLLPILVGVLLWNQLPQQMATHFDWRGEANGWSGRAFTVFGLPCMLAGFHLLCAVGTAADPRRRNISSKLFHLLLWICPLCSWFCSVATYAYALGVNLDISLLTVGFMTVLFVVVGNYLPKCRQNYTMGIKLPWTLADEENWNHTHRFAGWLWTLCGVLMFPVYLLGWKIGILVLFAIMVLLPVGYSYLYYRRHFKEE